MSNRDLVRVVVTGSIQHDQVLTNKQANEFLKVLSKRQEDAVKLLVTPAKYNAWKRWKQKPWIFTFRRKAPVLPDASKVFPLSVTITPVKKQ